MEHFTSGRPLLAEGGEAISHDERETYEGDTAQVVAEIKDLLDTRIRPAVARDGGDILFNRFDASTGVVYLHMRGACSGCPSSSATLRSGVENMLKHYVPEVTRVEAAL
jgi:Fe-S cluster biogenesis protein NfuA